MARHKTRRGGAWYDPRSWFTKSPEQKAKECAAKKADYDKECGPGEASATEVPTDTPVTEPTPTLGGRSRRRRQTRRKSRKMRGGAKSLKVTVVGTSSDDLSGNEINDLQAAITYQYRAKTKGSYTVSVEEDDLVLTYTDANGESADIPDFVPLDKEVTLTKSGLAKHLKKVKFSA